ncbi:MAG TPA: response regulator, partial [Ktedonobacterales bacterium]|nr:response regulator [Ktedonobacterales bacterium]
QVVLILDPIDMLQRPPRSGAAVPFIPAPGMMPGPQGSQSSNDPRIAARPSDVLRGARSGQPPAAPYVLVVDDSPSVRRFVSATLKNVGWDVMTARDGAEALELIAQRMPAAVLLDIEMPRMDGYELMAAIRNQPAYQHLPLIVLTSRAATKHQQRALQLGADAYVVKPYQDDQLLRTIGDLVPVNPDGSPKRR